MPTSPTVAELVAARLAGLGCQGAVLAETPANRPVPTDVTLKAYWSPAWGDIQPLTDAVRAVVAEANGAGLAAGTGEVSLREIAEESWADSWKQYFHPMRIGRQFIVTPTWEDPQAVAGDRVIQLDPGMAFGTGQHGTTQLCLAWLEDLPASGRSLLDVGTGSGILAIGAAQLGFGPLVACDTDPLAIAVAAENLALNDVTGVELIIGGLEAVSGAYDVLVANILAEVIIELAPQWAGHMTSGGHLVASGIITRKADDVTAALAAHGLTVLERRDQGEWVALLAKKNT
ncbi:MAG: 50S ribosomal protein L11 methyltransferase [Candidatus Sericytochromatia bacterium]|nr:50S ribosomal protein L11 methyltransferase [Candidatus Sericytochromatia bacterium]